MTGFTGLSAFPLTPLRDDAVDDRAFAGLVERLSSTGVDSITALGSTGSYAYLTTEERAHVARIAVEHAGETPVVVGIGAPRTSHVVANAEAAQAAGASGMLIAPMTYQPLTHDDVVACRHNWRNRPGHGGRGDDRWAIGTLADGKSPSHA